MLTAKLAYLDGEVYKLTAKGVFTAQVFIAYRKLLKKSQKGG